MSLQVHLSLGERFINWFPYNTKLYVRGERGKLHKVVDALYADLHKNLSAFFAANCVDRNRVVAAQKEALENFREAEERALDAPYDDFMEAELQAHGMVLDVLAKLLVK